MVQGIGEDKEKMVGFEHKEITRCYLHMRKLPFNGGSSCAFWTCTCSRACMEWKEEPDFIIFGLYHMEAPT